MPVYECAADFTGDGTVNILDIILVINQILSGEFDQDSDLNGDDMLNILDIVQLVNLILG